MPVISAVATIGSGLIGADAAKDAARAQGRAADAATAEQRRRFDLINQQNAPYREAGTAALNQLMSLYGLGGQPQDLSVFENSPDYQFARQQGEQALLRNRAALGGLQGGQTGAALQQYGQGLASQQLGNYRNALMGVIGAGQGANQLTGQAAFGTGQSVGQNMIGAGEAAAGGQVGQGRAYGGILTGLGKAFESFAAPKIQPRQPGWYQGNLPSEVGR